MKFSDDWRIPVEPGQAVDRGWTAATDFRPVAVTWHWTATTDLQRCNELLGGAQAKFRGIASAHYGVGRTWQEGVERYVSLADRSWHAGKNQILRWDGQPMASEDFKGARTAIGVETVNPGYARPEVPASDDWIRADSADGQRRMLIAPWRDEQVEMMIAVGREIVASWPHIQPRHHHGHVDLCPTYKYDPAGFPYARVLREIYDEPEIPDVWSSVWTARGRRRALAALGYRVAGLDEAIWNRHDDLALRRFQQDQGLPANGLWTTSVSWQIADALAA